MDIEELGSPMQNPEFYQKRPNPKPTGYGFKKLNVWAETKKSKKRNKVDRLIIILNMPKIRRNKLIEIISINGKCLNSLFGCYSPTYCKTKQTRGDLSSFPIPDIVNRAKQAFSENVKELWITSEDTGAYGLDINTNLPTLLKEIIKIIPDGCKMRVGMTNPPYILNHIEEMCEILKNDKVYSFMHIPVQSGSDSVLYSMKREYTISDFTFLVEKLRENVPYISIATDIIAGYPSESECDWEDTMTLCKKYKFSSLFTNQFFARPGTVAAKMDQIDRKIIKNRTKELSAFFKSYTSYDDMVGQIQNVLITEIAFDKISLVGHNKYYQQVLISSDCQSKFNYLLIGRILKVEIIKAEKHSLKASVISDVSPSNWNKEEKIIQNKQTLGITINGSGDAKNQVTLDHIDQCEASCNDCSCSGQVTQKETSKN